MSEPFLAEIRIFGFSFAPRGWGLCDGQILPISQNQSLYSLLGTTYGGDGRTTFALPDLRGRVPIHKGSSNGTNHQLGQKGGEETHTLAVGELPGHTHVMAASNQAANTGSPSGALYATAAAALGTTYSDANAALDTQLATNAIGATGNDGHGNMQPFTTLSFGIALQGLFPSRN